MSEAAPVLNMGVVGLGLAAFVFPTFWDRLALL